jgi:hypothetical protein
VRRIRRSLFFLKAQFRQTSERQLSRWSMSALGQKQTYAVQHSMSALLPKADMCIARDHVCFGPKADIGSLVDMKKGPYVEGPQRSLF